MTQSLTLFEKHLETERFFLKCYSLEMLEEHTDILNNWDVTQWLSSNIKFPYTLEEGRKYIKTAIEDFDNNISRRFSVVEKITGQHVGGIILFSLTEESEVGYWLGPKVWGKGVCSEILTAIVDMAFRSGVTRRLVAQTADNNVGSRRVLEKAGFQFAGSPPPAYARGGHTEAGCCEFFHLDFEDWNSK